MKLRTLLGLLIVGAAALVCIPFAPTNLGGHTTYVTTHGTSMLPKFHPGDLAVVQPAAQYHVGDVVAYRSTTLRNATVLHRIISIDTGRYSFKGDNNDFVDPDEPEASQLVGRLKTRIPHGGAIRAWLVRPIVLFPLLALVIGGAGSGLLVRVSRRRRSARRTPVRSRPGIRPVRPLDRIRVVVPLVAVLAVSGCMVAEVALWRVPQTERTTSLEPYRHTLTLGYSGTAPEGATYPNGTLETGDPIFTRLIRKIDINVASDFEVAAVRTNVTTTYDVVAEITNGTGWHQELVIGPRHTLTGAHVRAVATLDLETLQQAQAAFTAETHLDATHAKVVLIPRVRVAASVDGTNVNLENFGGKLEFSMTPVELLPVRSKADGPTTPTAANSGRVKVAVVRTRTILSLWGLDLTAATARMLALVATALVLGGIASAMAAHRRYRARGELAAIEARYGRLLVDTRELPHADRRTVVRVESMCALGRLAAEHEQLILQARTSTGRHFAVLTDAAIYVYEVAERVPARVEALATT